MGNNFENNPRPKGRLKDGSTDMGLLPSSLPEDSQKPTDVQNLLDLIHSTPVKLSSKRPRH